MWENDRRNYFMINCPGSYVAELGFELKTLGSEKQKSALSGVMQYYAMYVNRITEYIENWDGLDQISQICRLSWASQLNYNNHFS